MSISHDILRVLDRHTKDFLERFGFYLDATHKVFVLQGKMGLDAPAMQGLSKENQNLVKTYVFLVESANTTWAAAIRLLSSGFIADSYALIRILYEVGALLHYGNSSPPATRSELHRAMFQSGLSEDEHRKQEWRLIQKATHLIEAENPGLAPIRRELNNFGGHISRAKVVLGNVAAFGGSSASRVFAPNWSDNRYLAGLDFLIAVTTLILEEYARLQETYDGIFPEVQTEVRELAGRLVSTVRPRLQRMMKT